MSLAWNQWEDLVWLSSGTQLYMQRGDNVSTRNRATSQSHCDLVLWRYDYSGSSTGGML